MSETIFVLLAIDTTPNPAPNEIWAFCSQAEAESFLKGWSEDFLGGYTHDVNDLPPDAELVAAFRNAGTRIHLYQCDLEGSDSEELTLFERASESPYPRELVVIGPRGGTSMQKFELHPFALAFPPLTKAECEMLRASIERDGVVVPILIYQGKILDGRNRAYFAEMFHKPVKIEVFEGTEEEARQLLIARNLHCRHLSPTQVQLVAGRLSSDDIASEQKDS